MEEVCEISRDEVVDGLESKQQDSENDSKLDGEPVELLNVVKRGVAI